MRTDIKSIFLPTLSLFTSVGTLVCCALPALFVALGAGAAFAGLVSNVPQLVWISRYKVEVFILAGVLIAISGIMRYKNRYASCPIDPVQAKACLHLRKLSGWIFGGAVVVYAIGGFFSFIAPRFL